MITLLLSLSYQADPKCVGAHAFPDPVESMTPVYAQVLLRHGARTPLITYLPPTHRGFWLCDSDDSIAPRMLGSQIGSYRRFKHVMDPRLTPYLPNCQAGDLIVEGMEQHYELGKLYYSYVVDKLHLLKDTLNTSQIYVRCTDFERTLRSVQSFLYGFYPPEEPGELIHIDRGNTDLSVLRPDSGFCADLKALYVQRNSNDTFLSFYNAEWDAVAPIATALNVSKSIDNLETLCDWVQTMHCTGRRLPSEATDDIITQCMKVVGTYIYFPFNLNPFVAGSYIMRELIRVAKDAISGSGVKFSINSAHDDSICSLMTMVTGTRENVPGFASHFLMEIWKDTQGENWVRFALNGEVVPLKEMGNAKIVKFNDFLDKHKAIYNYCAELP